MIGCGHGLTAACLSTSEMHGGEKDLAYNYLRRRGYTIVARNYRPRSGKQELDLVAWDKEHLAVIEGENACQ